MEDGDSKSLAPGELLVAMGAVVGIPLSPGELFVAAEADVITPILANSCRLTVHNGLIIWNGLSVEQVPNSTIPVTGMIEELFRNATISLISNPLL